MRAPGGDILTLAPLPAAMMQTLEAEHAVHRLREAGNRDVLNDAVDRRAIGLALSPHQASATRKTRAATGEPVLANIVAHSAGRPRPTPVV